MKKILLFVCCLFAGTCGIFANTADTGLRYSGQWLNTYDSIVAGASGYFTVTMTKHTSEYKGWNVVGDLTIEEGDSTATSARIRSTGPGKGRIYYYYDDNPSADCKCGIKAVSLNVYKSFSPSAYNIDISGPDCVLEGDTVVYSIDPILTKNLTQGIGVDEYFWTFTPGLVQEQIYRAGDNSSVTFVAGEVDGNSSLSVQVGLANAGMQASKALGKAAPKPLLRDTCSPFDQTILELNIYNEEYPDLIYTWDYNPKWEPADYPAHDDNSQKRYHVVLYPDSGSGGVVTVTASYGNDDGCSSAGRATFNLSRSWGESAKITPEVVYAKNGGDFIKFQLSENSVPEMAPTWELPHSGGWVQKPGTTKHQFTYFARPENSIQYIDTIEVWANTCNSKDSCLAIVHMAPAKVASISNITCLVPGNSYTFSVESLEVGPEPTGYTWYINGDAVAENSSDTYTGVFTSNMKSIAVRSLGRDGWNADSTQISLSFRPIEPDSIISTDTCLFTGREIETTLYVQTPISGQTYHWSTLNGWTKMCDVSDSSVVTYSNANASQGEYPISVRASGTGNCPLSPAVEYSIKVKPMEWSINYEYIEDDENYKFSLYKNGVLNPHSPKQRALWYVDGNLVSTNPTATITIDSYDWPPQTVRAEFIINHCQIKPLWASSQGNNIARKHTTPTQKRTRKNLLNIFPNPANGVLNIDVNGISKGELFIYSISGGLVSSMPIITGNHQINTLDLPNGVYYFVVRDANYRDMKKVIIQH